MVFGFDPRKLVKDQQAEEEKKVKDVLLTQERLDLLKEEKEAALRKRSNIRDALDSADKAVREYKYLQQHGFDAWKELKIKEDPAWEEKTFRDLEGFFGEEKTKQRETVEKKYGEIKKIKPQLASYEVDGTTGLLKVDSTDDPYSNEVGQIESLGYALVSGAIKIPYGFANLGAMILDWAGEKDLPVDQSKVAQLDAWFEQTIAGEVMRFSEEKAKQNALSRIVEVMVQFYGGWSAVGKHGVKVTDEAFNIFNKVWDAVKSGKYVKTGKNSNLTRGVKDVKKFNNLSKKQKFTSIAVGGGVAGAVVYDAENIGTFGDLAEEFGMIEEGEYTALDRKEKPTAKEDATRMLYNKLKFGGEMGFPIIPAIWGVGKIGKNIVSGTFKRAQNATKFDRTVEKYVSKPFRARSEFPEEQFQAMQRLKGKEESAKILSTDFLKNIDNIVKRLSKDTQVASNATGLTEGLSEAIVKLLNKGVFQISKGKIVRKGFNDKSFKAFKESLEKLKIPSKEINNILREIDEIGAYWSQYMNTIYKGGNLNLGLKEFTKLINDRIGSTLSTEYKIFQDGALKPVDGYVVSREIKDEVANIFRRNYDANKPRGAKSMTKTEARLTVDQVIKNVELDPKTAQPFFRYPGIGLDADKALITKSIAKNITGGGKFKPDAVGGLIQKESDLRAFQKLFGGYQDAHNLIANVTTDLANIAARDRYYNMIKQSSETMIKRGERGIVYPNYLKAAEGWAGTGENIITKSDGLKLPNLLGEEAYTVPINNMFTTEAMEQGLIRGAKNNLGSITKHWFYQAAVMTPKGLIQMGKTVGGPFTHARNFSSGAVTTIALGNLSYGLRHPLVFGKALWRALNTIQPQLLWKNKPGTNYTAGAKVNATELKQGGQALYRFLLDEGMVNTNAVYRDVLGLVEETQKLGWLKNMMEKPKNWAQKFVKAAQDLYVAEDDIWKIGNFLLEDQRIHDAYNAALKKGLIRGNEIPSDLEIMKMATKHIREFMPNYAYVSDMVQSTRRSPMGNFVSWPAEQIRTNTNIVTTSLNQMKDPVFKNLARERLAGWAIALGTIPPLAVWGGMQLYGITKDQLYAIKEFVPWFSKDSTVIPVYEDGKYKYIDFSRAFFYDVVTNPLQSVITAMEKGEVDDPVLPMFTKGLVRGLARLAEPFVSESIFLQGFLDVYARQGMTRHGGRIWNPEDFPGNKAWETIKYLTKLYAPGSNIQMERLYKSITGKTIKGTQYEVSDELLGLIGLRKAPLDLERSLEINVGQFLGAEADERKLIYAGTLTGDPVTDENKIIKQYIFANEQRLEEFNKMKRIYDAAKTLNVPEKTIREIFDSRNRGDIYQMIKKNRFKPFSISEGMEEAYKKIAKRYGIDNPLTKSIQKRIMQIEKQLYKNQRLNENYIIKDEDFIFPETKGDDLPEGLLPASNTNTPPLPPTSMPVANQAQLMAQKSPQTNLTRTEEALLSPSEKIIAART